VTIESGDRAVVSLDARGARSSRYRSTNATGRAFVTNHTTTTTPPVKPAANLDHLRQIMDLA
jgi:hypothetical protein